MIRSKRSLMIALTLLVVLALVFAGCGGGGGRGKSDNGNDDENNNGDSSNFSAYLGTWKSQGITPAVEIEIKSQIGGGDSYVFFTGRVTCENFKSGYLDITESDNDISGDKYILGHKIKTSNIHIMAREEYMDELLGTLANELSLDGFLADASTLRVVRLYIWRQYPELEYDFDSESDDEYLIFKKQ